MLVTYEALQDFLLLLGFRGKTWIVGIMISIDENMLCIPVWDFTGKNVLYYEFSLCIKKDYTLKIE